MNDVASNCSLSYYVLISGELWVGVTLAVIIELVPSSLRGSSVALYFFIISNIGGLGPLIVTPIENAFKSTGMDTATAIRCKDLIWQVPFTDLIAPIYTAKQIRQLTYV